MSGGVVGAIGDILITDPNSRIAAQYMEIGQEGTGALRIEKGGAVTIREDGFLAAYAGSVGAAVVDGSGSMLSIAQLMSVGYEGGGTLDVTKGGSVNTGQSMLGDLLGSTGFASVTGLGSQWSTKTALTVANAGTGALNIANGGVVTSQTATIALQTGSVGIVNIGPQGTFNTGDITFGAGKGTINFDTAGDYEFASAMSGAGNLNVLSGKVILSGDSSAFTGKTQVFDKSVLSVNGALGDVLRGGTLGGIGTVGSMTIDDLAVFAPGNSIGTMHVNGDLTFSPGSTYLVETSADGTSDKTLVSGVAALNGAHVQVEADTGNWQPSTTYTILTATGGVSGQFSDVKSNLYFLDPEIGYPDANTVILSLKRNDIAADPIIDRIIDGDPNDPLVDNILTLDKKNAPRTTAQLPGRIYGSLAGVLLDDSRFINEAVNNRMRSAFGVTSTPMPVLAFGPDGAELQAATTDRFALWAQGFGSWMDKESDAAFAGLDRSIGGVFAGGDAAIGDHTRLGLVGGYSQADLDEPDLTGGASVDSYYAGVYGGTELGAVNLRSGVSYTWHDIGIERQVQFTDTREYLGADYHAGTAQAFGEIGYKIKTANVDLEPFANLAYANSRSGGFTETGGTAALSGSVSTNDVTYSTLGLHASTELSLGFTDARLRGTAAWRHAYGDTTPVSRNAFAGSGAFDISGLPIARDAAWLEAGFDVDVARNTTIGLSYQGQLASKVQDHGFMANFNLRF
jgi:subtilase-type serine protease